MSAFNDINGVPASANAFTLRQVLREEWEFDGPVVSDFESVQELIEHGYAADSRDAAMKAIAAGVNMEMVSTSFYDHGASLIQSGQLGQSQIDEAVRNILRLKLRLGLFGAKGSSRTRRPRGSDAGGISHCPSIGAGKPGAAQE